VRHWHRNILPDFAVLKYGSAPSVRVSSIRMGEGAGPDPRI
jgi:hypothetical protein